MRQRVQVTHDAVDVVWKDAAKAGSVSLSAKTDCMSAVAHRSRRELCENGPSGLGSIPTIERER